MSAPASPSLADFLLARIAEDESLAAAHNGGAYSRWHFEPDPDPGRIGGRVVGLGRYAEVANDWSSPHNPAAYIGVSRHIARWDPARVLAECEAKRRIIACSEALRRQSEESLVRMREFAEAGVPIPKLVVAVQEARPDWLDPTLLDLAQVYADHPDYRPEWRR